MKNVSEAAFQTFTEGNTFRGSSYLRGAGPLAHPGKNDDEIRLKKVLKRAVERESAPQSLIDAITNRIRNSNESR